MSLLTVSDLQAGYGELQILDDVDVTVEANEYVTIIGPNGAGKSTLMRAIFGLADHMGGSITFEGDEISGANTVDIIQRGLALAPQEGNIFPDLTVMENLQMGAYTHEEFPREALDRVYERFPILEERTDQTAGDLSGGQQQMLAIGRALMLEPELLALDEPSAGLAPNLVQDLFDEIDAINESGTAVLLVEQNAEEALSRSDTGYLLTQGRIRREDDADALLQDETVQEEFVGG